MTKKAEQYVDLTSTLKDTKDINYDTGEKIQDLIPKEIPDEIKGKQIDDTDYTDDIYSDDQLKRHQEAGINPYTVDGIPSRWEHNKLRSKWHFDPKADPNEETYKVICKFNGDWDAGIKRALTKVKNIPLATIVKEDRAFKTKAYTTENY